jgi:HK97 family phage prohead protease
MNRPQPGTVEQRTAPDVTLNVDDRRLRGVVPYGVESRDLGGWREVIDAGALDDARMDDLVATVDHAGVPLGRYPGTLEVDSRPDGLHWAVTLPDSRSDVREAVQRGDLRAASWRMVVARDRWDGHVRHVERIAELRDVSVVTTPAYTAARAEYRAAPDPLPAPPANHPPKELPMQIEDRESGTGLAVEDRAAAEPNIEARVLDAIKSVARGESGRWRRRPPPRSPPTRCRTSCSTGCAHRASCCAPVSA